MGLKAPIPSTNWVPFRFSRHTCIKSLLHGGSPYHHYTLLGILDAGQGEIQSISEHLNTKFTTMSRFDVLFNWNRGDIPRLGFLIRLTFFSFRGSIFNREGKLGPGPAKKRKTVQYCSSQDFHWRDLGHSDSLHDNLVQ